MTTIPPDPVGYYSSEPPRPFQGYRTGSIVFGILAIILGAFSGCMGLLAPLALLVPRPKGLAAPRPGGIVSGALLYVFIAGSLIWLGIGTVKLRRWVRPLVLTVGAFTLITGVLSIIVMAIMVPGMRVAMSKAPGAQAQPPQFVPIIITVMFVVMVLLMIVLPLAFVWFFRSPRVKEMLELYDPQPRWTDGCPLPVLGLSVGLAMFGASGLVSCLQGVAPVFGTLLTGLPAMAVYIIGAAAAFLLARLAYRREPAAWWGSIALVVIWTLAMGSTMLRPDRIDLYRQAGYTDQEVDAIKESSISGARLFAVAVPAYLLAFGYLFYVRKYFVGRGRSETTPR